MIWDFDNLLSRRLALWAGLSMLSGFMMLLPGNPFWQAFGIQALAWGAVDGLISWIGLIRVQKHLGKSSTFDAEINEARHIRRLLWINNALDVVYMAGGAAILFFFGMESIFWRGTGWGVIVQGVFLFSFDLWHALRVPEPLQLPHLPIFSHPDHEAFIFDGGKPAAVLVHGFPGTALEMRPLGKILNDTGWTVRGIRLPGFGPELAEIIEFSNEDWVRAVQEACRELRAQEHSPLLLVGFSFGGAIAIQAAVHEHPEGLILISPMTWREPRWGKVLADFARSLLPLSVHPLRHIPLDHFGLAREYQHYMPEIDLQDPEHRSELPHLQIPLYILDQIREVGRKGFAAAPKVHAPTLLIQGTRDRIIQPQWIENLREQLGAPVTYEKVDGQHSLTMPHDPAFNDVAAKTLAFAAQIIQSQTSN